MLKEFISVAEPTKHEICIRRSRFIAHVFPVGDEGEASKRLREIQMEYSDATHNVFAWHVGVDKTIQRYSDDGEPGGTAGRPVLEVIKQNNLVNVLIVVTRYFGGIKLGAGGLVRAYSQAAREAVDKAGIVKKSLHVEYEITVDYPHWGLVRQEGENRGNIKDVAYSDRVTFHILVPKNRREDFQNIMRDLTGDNIVMKKKGLKYHEI